MNPTTKTGKTLTDTEIAAIASDFENNDITPDTITKIKKTHRNTPRLSDTNIALETT